MITRQQQCQSQLNVRQSRRTGRVQLTCIAVKQTTGMSIEMRLRLN